MFIFEGLDVCIGYEVQVLGFCGDFLSGWFEFFFFFMICNLACDSDVVMLIVFDFIDIIVMLVWVVFDVVLSYELQVCRSGIMAWDIYLIIGLEF